MEEKADRNINELSKLRNKKVSIIKNKNININNFTGFILFLLLCLNIVLLISILLNVNRHYYPKENDNYSDNKYQRKSKNSNNHYISDNLKANKIIKIDSINDYLKNKFKEEIIFLEECLNGNNIEKFEEYENPKLSILIPFYNSEKYLNRLLRSIQKQKIKELEIIFIDDYSLDNGPLLLEEYRKLDKRIKINIFLSNLLDIFGDKIKNYYSQKSNK